MTEAAIRATKLTRDFGTARAVDALTLEVPPGIIFGFLGANGAGKTTTVEAGMWLVGSAYNFCRPHRSLRRWRTADDPPGGHWVEHTPAQAAGLTDHRWSVHALLTVKVPPPPVRRRGRRPRWLREVAHAA